MSRELIAVDIDEVLYPFTPQFVAYHNKQYGTSVSVDDFTTYAFEDVLDIPLDEAVRRIYAYHETDDSHVEPIAQAQESLALLSRTFDLVNVTARNPMFEAVTQRWIHKHFPGMFRDIILIGHAAVMERPRTKTEVCQEIGAFALVDDSFGHASHAAQGNMRSVLFGDYLWNQAKVLPAGVTRCKDWPAVVDYFHGRES